MIHVVAAVMVKGGAVLVAQRAAGGRQGGLWEFPGGKVEAGEAPEAALQRELHEELGVDVVVGDCLGREVHEDDRGRFEIAFYRVGEWRGEPVPHEHDAIAWVAQEGLSDYAFAPADRGFVDGLAATPDWG